MSERLHYEIERGSGLGHEGRAPYLGTNEHAQGRRSPAYSLKGKRMPPEHQLG
jgi:hypothetical protein